MTKPEIIDDTTWRASPAAHAALHLELARLAADEAEALRSVDDWPGDPEAEAAASDPTSMIDLPELTPREQQELDALAATFKVCLRADFNDETEQWGAWCWDPAAGQTEQSSDLIATGPTAYEAIDAARTQLLDWWGPS